MSNYDLFSTLVDFTDENGARHIYFSNNPVLVEGILEVILCLKKHSEDENYLLSNGAVNDLLRQMDDAHKADGGLAKVLMKGFSNYFDDSDL